MPVYEFRCPACGKVFEHRRPREKAGDDARCPDDGKQAHRIFGAAIIGVGETSSDAGLGDLGDMGGMGGGMPGMDGLDMGGDLDF